MRTTTRHLTSFAIAGVITTAGAGHAAELPPSMIWTSYDVGSAGYAEASAIADAFGREYDTRVRIQPSGSAIGRLQPVLQGRADFGYLATETYFATEGTHDFASRRWGPQDLRVVAGRPSSFAMPTAADAGIREIADAAGKRIAYVAGNPSTSVKCDALLAAGGLSRDDVEVVMFPTYGAAMSSMAQNEADATCALTTTSQLYELEQSPRGIHWVGIPPEDEEAWGRIRDVAPFFQPFEETVGAGISEENPVNTMAYKYPLIVTTANKEADDVYAFTKALDETYDLYKDATAIMPRWEIDRAGQPPADAPFHEGAIRYFEEKGLWTEEHQAWNEARQARLEAVIGAWDNALAEAEGKSDEAFSTLWAQYREQALANL